MRQRLLGYLVIVLVTAAVSLLAQYQWHANVVVAQGNHVARARAETRTSARQVEQQLSSIYENLRTLASLPSLRGIDRHAKNLSTEARTTFQQIYNNLAVRVAVSEVYVLPIDFNPGKFDPITLKPEEPIIRFDHLIVNATADLTFAQRQLQPEQVADTEVEGPAEVEEFAYRDMARQMAVLQATYPNLRDIKDLDFPMISGEEVVTCDNSMFILTGKDADRSGVVFSVPFYGRDGVLRGAVSAIVLTNALKNLLPAGHLGMVNPQTQYAVFGKDIAAMDGAAQSARLGKPLAKLFYSEALPLSIGGASEKWTLWAGLPNAAFESSLEKQAIDNARMFNLIAVAVLAAIGALAFTFYMRGLDARFAMVESNRLAREAQDAGALVAVHAGEMQNLNAEVSRLNTELSGNLSALRDAQDEIIKKGRQSQLANLIAIVAHEIRNPLGSVRNSTFLIRRKLGRAADDVAPQLDRIESGISRCDALIGQLLDYAQHARLMPARFDVERWLTQVVKNQADRMPSYLEIELALGHTEATLFADSAALTRVVRNLMENAEEAVTHAKGKHGAAAARLLISTRSTGRGIEIEFKDNAAGMNAETAKKALEPLFTTKSFGAGLGLPSAQKMVEAHGGGLDLMSMPGKGTSVTIWLPLEGKDQAA